MIICPICASEVKRKDHIFCSWECYLKDRLGKPLLLETRHKISLSHLGKPMSDVARKHMSESHKGIPLSEENKKNISLANKGHIVSEDTRKMISVANKGNKNWLGKHHTAESKKKMSTVQKGKIISKEQRIEISKAHKGIKENLTLEQRQKRGEAHKGNKYCLGKTAWNRGKPMCQETKDKIIAKWNDPVYIIKQQKALHNRPNKPEKELYNILDTYFPDTYTYTGDFGFMLGGKNPDFTNMDEKKTIDLYGDYFHKGENPQERIDYFKKFGYKSLVIWECELKNINLLKSKLLNFQYS